MRTIKIIGRLFMSIIALYLFYLGWYILGTIDRNDTVSVLLFITIMAFLFSFAFNNAIKCFKRK